MVTTDAFMRLVADRLKWVSHTEPATAVDALSRAIWAGNSHNSSSLQTAEGTLEALHQLGWVLLPENVVRELSAHDRAGEDHLNDAMRLAEQNDALWVFVERIREIAQEAGYEYVDMFVPNTRQRIAYRLRNALKLLPEFE